MTLTIKVTKTDFDAASSQLHVSGKIAEGNEYVKNGSFHTLDLELHRAFTLAKNEGWDSIALQQLKEAIGTEKRANLWACIMAEGEANICFITDHQTVLRQRVVVPIPKKKAQAGDYDKAVGRFHKTLLDTLMRSLEIDEAAGTVDTTTLKPLLLASPAFWAQNFANYIKRTASSGTSRSLIALVPMITVAHSSSANLAALAEVLKGPAVTSQLRDTRFAKETRLMDSFYDSLRKDDGKSHYGQKEVIAVIEKGAVGRGGGVLLINDHLFRAQDVRERRKWVALVDRVRDDEGGEVRVLSSVHESGKRLEALGGIAALTTYPIFEDDDEDGDHTNGAEDGET